MSHSELRDGTPRSRPGEWLIVNACFLGFSPVLFLFRLLLALVSLLPLIVKVTFSNLSRAGRSRCTREAIQRLPSQRFSATQPHNSHLNSVSFVSNAILGNFSIDLIFFLLLYLIFVMCYCDCKTARGGSGRWSCDRRLGCRLTFATLGVTSPAILLPSRSCSLLLDQRGSSDPFQPSRVSNSVLLHSCAGFVAPDRCTMSCHPFPGSNDHPAAYMAA